ncbi:MAG: histidine utilization repressor [Proteobacteria bacterium]|nr:histidine utilization repressor [Pseudomonadota bacterium]
MTQRRFQTVKDHVLDAIASGALKVGDRTPSESELVARFGVSRMTANRALKELTEAGVLTRTAGVGTFVADRRARGELVALRDIADEIVEAGGRYAAEVRVHAAVPADAALAEAFERPVGAPLFHARVLHFRDEVPVLLEERWVDPEAAPDFLKVDLTQETSYRHLTRVAPLQEAEHAIQAVAPTPELKTLLRLAPGEPCLLLRRRTWTGGRPASVASLWHAGSRWEIAGRFRP